MSISIPYDISTENLPIAEGKENNQVLRLAIDDLNYYKEDTIARLVCGQLKPEFSPEVWGWRIHSSTSSKLAPSEIEYLRGQVKPWIEYAMELKKEEESQRAVIDSLPLVPEGFTFNKGDKNYWGDAYKDFWTETGLDTDCTDLGIIVAWFDKRRKQ